MATIKASNARIPPDMFNRAAYRGERIRIERRNEAVYLIGEDEMALFEALEDLFDNREADKALAEMKGRRPIPWDKVKADLGL